MVPGLQHKSFASFDGTEIAYQVRGEGPCVVFANGLGGTFEAFRHLYAALGDRYKVICWDYRGLYRSGRPRDLRTLAVPYHCRDLERLLSIEHVDRAIFLGWSMGVQVNFEFFREHRSRMAGIVVVNGTYGSPFRTAMASRLSKYLAPLALSLMKQNAPHVSKLSAMAIGWSGFVPTMQRFGLVAPQVDVDAMNDVAKDFATLDFALYSEMLKKLGEHDARDLLPAIDLPTLIITGDKDLMTPVFTARKMNRKIAGSRLVVIEGASHYAPVEYPKIVCDELVRFLGGIAGWAPTEAAGVAGGEGQRSR